MPGSTQLLRRWVPWLGLLLATAAMTWPVIVNVGSLYAGHWSDLCVTLWDMKWVERVVLEGRELLFTTHIFFPRGVSLAYHSISWLSGLWALPLRLLFGPIAGYNLFFLSQTFMCAAMMFVAVRRMSDSASCGWLSAIVFAFAPFRMLESCSHPNLAGTCFVPLAMLGFWQGVRDGRQRWVGLSAISVALTLLTGVHLFVMTSIALVSYWLSDAIIEQRYGKRAFWWWSIRVAVATAVCCALPLAQFFLVRDQMSGALDVPFGSGRMTDILGLWMPHRSHPLLGALGRRMQASVGEPVSYSVYLGFLPFLLACASLLVPSKMRRSLIPVAITAVLLLCLSMGQSFVVASQDQHVSLPLLLIADLPPIAVLRHPDRFMLIFSAFFAPLVGCGVAALCKRHSLVPWLTLVLGVGVLGEYYTRPFRTEELKSIAILSALPRDGLPLLELPLTREQAKLSMFQQTLHDRPLVNGMVARSGDDAATSYLRSSALLRRLSERRAHPYRCRDFELRRAWNTLENDGIGYVVVHKGSLGKTYRVIKTYLTGKPLLEDKDHAVYRIADLASRQPNCI